MIIKSKIIKVDIEVGDIIYTSVSNLRMWGEDEDVQNGVSICVIPNTRKYKDMLIPLKYLGNNVFEDELTHTRILCFRASDIYVDIHYNTSECKMADYEEKLISCDLDYESYRNNPYIEYRQKNIIDYLKRLKAVHSYCGNFPVTFCIDTGCDATIIVNSASQEVYNEFSSQEKVEVLTNIYEKARESALLMTEFMNESIKKEIEEEEKLKKKAIEREAKWEKKALRRKI